MSGEQLIKPVGDQNITAAVEKTETVISPGPDQQIPDPVVNTKPKKKGVLVVFIFLFLIILTLSGFLYLKDRSKSDSEKITKETPLPTVDHVGESIVTTPTISASEAGQLGTVDSNVISSLQANDIEAIYEELSPSQQNLFPKETFLKSWQDSIGRFGKIVKVEVVEPVAVLTGSEWNNSWAQSRIRIEYEKTTKEYVSRYYYNESRWYLYATVDVTLK